MPEIGVYEAMSTLRAVRRLRPDPIPDDVLRRVIQAACWGPTGGNNQPWRVIAVRDAATKRALKDLYAPHWNAYEARTRANMERLPPEPRAKLERMVGAARHLADHFHEAPVILVFCFNPQLMAITDAALGRPSVVGGGSVYPSVQNALLACRAEGLGCTLTTLLCMSELEVKKLLELPAEWHTCAYVPIGYPASRGHGPISRRPPSKMAFLDRWERPLFAS
jgi:nitroreductase